MLGGPLLRKVAIRTRIPNRGELANLPRVPEVREHGAQTSAKIASRGGFQRTCFHVCRGNTALLLLFLGIGTAQDGGTYYILVEKHDRK